MKYYEFEYDNIWQKILWGLEIVSVGALCPIIIISMLLIIPNQFSTVFNTTILALSILGGFVLSIYNCQKFRGVFVFEDYIEINGYYPIGKKIKFNDIVDLNICAKQPYIRYVSAGFPERGNGGGRRNCLEIKTYMCVNYIKVKNQDELSAYIISKCGKNFSICNDI